MNTMFFTYSDFKEKISHTIANRPYSLHKTDIQDNRHLILYQHWHDEIEFLYLDKGEMELIVEDKRFHMKAGEALLIPPNMLHMGLNIYNSKCCFTAFLFNPIVFTEAYANSQYNRYIHPLKCNGSLYTYHFTPNIGWHKELLLKLCQIQSFYGRKDIDSWELELHGLLYQLWNLYYNNFMLSINLSSSYNKLYNKLRPSIDFIHENYVSDLSLELLAEQSGVCEGTFCRYFKELTGKSAFTYIIHYRIKKSCELLINTDMKISHIAGLCGFNNISHFNRTFQQYMKCKPSEYRNQ